MKIVNEVQKYVSTNQEIEEADLRRIAADVGESMRLTPELIKAVQDRTMMAMQLTIGA